MSSERTHDRVRRHVNGRWSEMDDGTQIAVTVLADEIDELRKEVTRLHSAINKLQRTATALGLSMVGSMLSLIATLLTR